MMRGCSTCHSELLGIEGAITNTKKRSWAMGYMNKKMTPTVVNHLHMRTLSTGEQSTVCPIKIARKVLSCLHNTTTVL